MNKAKIVVMVPLLCDVDGERVVSATLPSLEGVQIAYDAQLRESRRANAHIVLMMNAHKAQPVDTFGDFDGDPDCGAEGPGSHQPWCRHYREPTT